MLEFKVDSSKLIKLQDLQVGDIFISQAGNKYQVMEIRDDTIDCYYYEEHRAVNFTKYIELSVQAAWRDGEVLKSQDSCFSEVHSMSEMKFGQIFKFLKDDLFVFLGCDMDKGLYTTRNLQTGGINTWEGFMGPYYVLNNDEVTVKFEEVEN